MSEPQLTNVDAKEAVTSKQGKHCQSSSSFQDPESKSHSTRKIPKTGLLVTHPNETNNAGLYTQRVHCSQTKRPHVHQYLSKNTLEYRVNKNFSILQHVSSLFSDIGYLGVMGQLGQTDERSGNVVAGDMEAGGAGWLCHSAMGIPSAWLLLLSRRPFLYSSQRTLQHPAHLPTPWVGSC